jgi:flavin reductase (DIM6/NTAB) family NADH-FMN oxidoreductase RutF
MTLESLEAIDAATCRGLLSPRPTAVLVTWPRPDGSPNPTTVSWYTPISDEPLRLGIALRPSTLAWEWARKTRMATLNVLGVAWASGIDAAGRLSGRDGAKWGAAGLHPVAIAPGQWAVGEAFMVVALQLEETAGWGTRQLTVWRVAAAWADPRSHEGGILRLSDDRWRPVHHLADGTWVAMTGPGPDAPS